MVTSNGVKKIIIIIVLLLLVGGGGYYLYQKNQAKAPSDGQDFLNQQSGTYSLPDGQASSSADTVNSANQPGAVTPNTQQGTFSSGEENIVAPDIQVWQIEYDGAQFNPKSLNIKFGDYVIFKNLGTQEFWPASDPHPDHTGYAGFDARKPIATEGKYQFQFMQAGSWGFHDHLNPSATGVINVAR